MSHCHHLFQLVIRQVSVESVAHFLEHIDYSIAALLVVLLLLFLVAGSQIADLSHEGLELRAVVGADGAVHVFYFQLPRVVRAELLHLPDAAVVAVDGAVDGAERPTVTVAEGHLVPYHVVTGQPTTHVCKIECIGIVVVRQPFRARHGATEIILTAEALQRERRRAVLRRVVVAGRGVAHILVEGIGQCLQAGRDGHGVALNDVLKSPLLVLVAPVRVLRHHAGRGKKVLESLLHGVDAGLCLSLCGQKHRQGQCDDIVSLHRALLFVVCQFVHQLL